MHGEVVVGKKKAEIVVSVLESPYTMLQKSGVPLTVCMCMEGKGLQLGNAHWTASQAVTFFWRLGAAPGRGPSGST